MSRMPHIVQLSHEPTGRRYAIGDLHGSSKGFRAVLDKLQPDDELFCVGDLLDRLDGSLAIFQALQQTTKKVYVTRGNHENMLLRTIDAIAHFKAGKLSTRHASDLLTHLNCGGGWLFTKKRAEVTRLFKEKYAAIQVLKASSKQTPEETFLSIQKAKTACAIDILTRYQDTLIEDPTLLAMKQYIESLPYIILVGHFSKKHHAFAIVHADMPIDDTELEERLTGKNGKTPMLTETEINHAIWARVDTHEQMTHPITVKRNEEAILTIVGHNIINETCKETYDDETGFTELSVVRAIRAETNTINLDVGAYSNREVFLLTDLTQHTVIPIGPKGTETKQQALLDIAEKITDHLQTRRTLTDSLDSLNEIQQKLTTHLVTLQTQAAQQSAGFFQYSRLTEIASIHQLREKTAQLLKGDKIITTKWTLPENTSDTLKEIDNQLNSLQHDSWVVVGREAYV